MARTAGSGWAVASLHWKEEEGEVRRSLSRMTAGALPNTQLSNAVRHGLVYLHLAIPGSM